MFLSVMLNYKKITKGSRPQIIHAHTATPSGFIAMLLKVIFRIPVVISLRGSDINIYPNQSKSIKLLTKYVIRRADAVTAVSKQLARKAIELGVFNKKISVVYNGCNVDIFKYNMERRNKIRSEYKLLFNDIILLFIGNLTKGKGIYNLIEIFKKISKTNKNIYLFIIGEGEEKNNLIKIIKQHQINEKVILLNGCSHESVADWMSASDIFVMLSKKEGLPNVILEAMACERPVVAGKVGGIPEIIEEEKYGTLVNLDDPITIEKKIEELIWKPEKRARMGRESRERIKTNFSWSETANKMMEIYRKINH
jgi:N-acetyl-alpha-D-glucosaminyl L-malate synthase BshA